MPELTGQPIVTNYGKAQILASTMDITKIKLGSGIWTPDETSTALDTEEQSVAATGAVIPIPAGGSRLHVNGQDASGDSYDVHEFALTDDTDQALVIYSQAAIIDTKGAASTLVFAADLVIEQAGVGTISISGVTDFDLPQSSTVLKGIIETATDAEAAAGTDTTRAVTSKHLEDVRDWVQAHSRLPKNVAQVEIGPIPQVLAQAWSPNGGVITQIAYVGYSVRVQYSGDIVTGGGDSAIVFATVRNRIGYWVGAAMNDNNTLEFTVYNASGSSLDPSLPQSSGIKINLSVYDG